MRHWRKCSNRDRMPARLRLEPPHDLHKRLLPRPAPGQRRRRNGSGESFGKGDRDFLKTVFAVPITGRKRIQPQSRTLEEDLFSAAG